LERGARTKRLLLRRKANFLRGFNLIALIKPFGEKYSYFYFSEIVLIFAIPPR